MPGKKDDVPLKGQQPEALATLKSAARHDGVKPADLGLDATRETAPKPEAPEKQAKQATKMLHAAAEADTRKSK